MHANWRIVLTGLLLVLGSAWAQATPQIQTWETPGGSRVYFIATDVLPMVDVRVVFDAGSARDGEKFGLATLTSGMLEAGAGAWDADAIAARLEGVGAQLGTGISRDMAWISLRSLTQPHLLDPALATAREIIVNPNFAEADFVRERQNQLTGIKRREESPGDLAGMAFFTALFGDHPYAHPRDGTLDTVAKLGREDLLAFHRHYYVAKNAVVVIVGATSRAQAEELTTRLLAGLPSGEAAPPLPTVPRPTAARELRQDFASAQTHVFAGSLGMKMNDPDYFPLFVGNHILGGGSLVSRISDEIREKRGLSYSAFSQFFPLRDTGIFLMSLQTNNAQAGEALAVLHKTLRDFIAAGPTEAEATAAKQNLTGGFPLRLDSNRELLEQLAMIGFYRLPLDYLDTYIARVEAVTAADIQKAFQSRIDPDRLLTVLVGAPPTPTPAPKPAP
jgi:zinc protease